MIKDRLRKQVDNILFRAGYLLIDEMREAILSLEPLAHLISLAEKAAEIGGRVVVVDDKAERPKFSFSEESPGMRFGYQLCQQDMAGWQKVVKEREDANQNS